MEEPELLLTVENAARSLQIGRSTLYMWIAQGLVPTFRIKRVIRIPRSALIRMIEAQVEATTTPNLVEEPDALPGTGSR